MQFMVVYHAGPEGLGPNVPLRWQHGPTPGVTVVSAWVSAAIVGDGSEGLAEGRTYVVIETDSYQGLAAYTNYMRPYVRQIEVRVVNDYLPQTKAYEAKDTEQVPRAPNATDEQRRRQLEFAKRYIAAASPGEALEIWRNTSGLGGGKDILEALKMRQELDRF
ncbi:MAG: hypothetical protein EXR50_05870 [Dehalococcoidia bacterium]|nr:hypothetical protein [Dehalococcoidia bacterium]